MKRLFGWTAETPFVNRLTYEVKYKVAEDLGIAYETRPQYLDENPDQLVSVLLANMTKTDRNRAVFDFLMDHNAAERTERIVNVNLWLMFWTALMALATVALAAVEVFKRH